MPNLQLQIFHTGRWWNAATLTVHKPTQGVSGSAELNYQLDYAAEFLDSPDPRHHLSCRLPVSFSPFDSTRWPAFVLDLMPSGAARARILTQAGLANNPTADWELLSLGAGNPPGNLRVMEAARNHGQILAPGEDGQLYPGSSHPGFTLEDILARREDFIEYAYQHGAVTAGASDVQGEAPKFLLVQDHRGRWHAEGAIEDRQVADFWLVKFPRGKTADDRKILRTEAPYLELARKLGLRTAKPLIFQRDALLIPRFDRRLRDQKVERLGLESLCSAAGIAQFGASPPHEQLVEAVYRYSDKPAEDIAEYLCRDVVNVVLGNQDNHARNTAFLKEEQTTLSPLFDFAPMYLDPEGIARVCRWSDDREDGGRPNWLAVVHHLQAKYPDLDMAPCLSRLRQLRDVLPETPAIMSTLGIDEDIINRRIPSVETHYQLLKEV